MRVLSIRQPWAWLIVNGYKDIENRKWPTLERGQVSIHAGKVMTHEEYLDAVRFCARLGVGVPMEHTLERGGIVGFAYLCGCVKKSESRWFTGPYGFKFRNAWPLPFQPCQGQLGFFDLNLSFTKPFTRATPC